VAFGMIPLVRQCLNIVERAPDALALAMYPPGAHTPSATRTWGELYARVRACAAMLVQGGIAAGDRVAVLASTRELWPVADLAIQSVRAIGVGLYPSSTPMQVDGLLRDSGARWLFTDDAATAQRLVTAPPAGVALERIVLDPRHDPATPPSGIESWHALLSEGTALLRDVPAVGVAVDARLASVTLDDLAALIYTSGSTGESKGACISHRYLAASAASILEVLGLTAADRAVSFLPFSHAAERVFGQATRVATGMAAALIEDPADLFPVCAHFEPTVVGGLPRIFERLDEAAELARRAGADPRAAITARLGPRVRVATSGGATMPAAVAERLLQLGLPVVGAYGQTEHLCIAMNRPDAPRFDGVGAPMPGTEVRIAEDGELLVRRSALTFDRYWGRPADTAAAFTPDGAWLRTGDRATMLPDGGLQITGRVKELLALSTGRKVAPVPIEAALTASPYIAHAVCIGEGRKFVVVVLSLRRAVVEAWAQDAGVELPWDALVQSPATQALLEAPVAAVNATLARPDRMQAIVVVPDEFTPENGLLTPTLKVRRRAVEDRYRALLDARYAAMSTVSAGGA
jgi:long-chain acyl-CoA synthetase